MDLSKLPKLSETKAPETPASTPEPAPQPPMREMDVQPRRFEPTAVGGEVWFGLIIGLILMLYTRSFGSYLIALMTGKTFDTGVRWTEGPNEGQNVPYPQLEGGTFYADSSIFIFGAALMIGAIAQWVLARRGSGGRSVAWFSLGCMAVATAYNIVASMILLHDGITPIMSLICVAIGGYIVYYEWAALKAAA